jgi:hypothetical protein
MKLREHRGLLTDSMETCIEIEPTRDALESAIKESLLYFFHFEKKNIHVEPYGYDDRIKWDTHIVTIYGYGVYGFTDGPLNVLTTAST